MKILVVTQYFWPEQFRINDIVKNFLEKGHQVDVITGNPSYPEPKIYKYFYKDNKKFNNYFGANIIRLPIIARGNSSPLELFINYISFILSGIFVGSYKIRKKKYDIIFTFATSPITVALPSIFFSFIKNAPHILWVLDIWPDILKELKIVKNNLLIIILKRVVNYIYLKSDIILVQSMNFKRIIGHEIKDESKLHYFPAWSENLPDSKINENFPLESKFYKNKFVIVFTGNIGEAQNFENIIKAAEIIKNKKDIQWLIVGTGRKIKEYSELINKKKINNFLFVGHQSIKQIKAFHKISNVLLVSLSQGKYLSATIPGKLQTYMKSNKFILGFINGAAAELIKESKTGAVVNPANPKKLAEILVYLKNKPKLIKKVSLNNYGPKFLKKYFNKNIILKNLEGYLKEVFQEIKIIRNVKDIPFNKNFCLSGLNLAFLGYYVKKKIKLTKNIYLWPDGFFYKRFFSNKKIIKIAGRKVVEMLKIPINIKNIYVIGNLDYVSKKYLQKHYKIKITHIPLPMGDVRNLYEKHCLVKFLVTDLIFLTLPTPKQEEFAYLIMKNNNFYKIICIGGAINIASGLENPVPDLLEKMNLEFVWRLRTDTFRRIRRLIITSLFYLKGELLFKYRNINKNILHEK